MTEFHEHGFLSSDMTEVILLAENRYKPWLDLLEKINLRAWETQYNIDVHKDNLQEILAALAYGRTLTNVQAAVLIAKRGMDTQARIVLRAALESMFSLMAVAESPDFAPILVATDEIAREKMLNKLKMWTAKDPTRQDSNVVIDKALSEIKKAIQTSGAKRISTEELSKKAKLHDWYLTVYPYFSASTHSTVRDLERHFVVDSENDFSELKNEPELNELANLFLTACEILLKSLGGVAKVFHLSVAPFVDEQSQALNKLSRPP